MDYADEWVDLEQFAAEAGVTVQTVWNWRTQGKGPRGHKIGRRVRFRRRDIEAWYERQADPERQPA